MMVGQRALKELQIGEIYTSEELEAFITYNRVVIICDEAEFTEGSNEKYQVNQVLNTYIHQYEYPNIYKRPDRKQKVFLISKVTENYNW